MLTKLSLNTLLDQEFEGCHRTESAELGGAVRSVLDRSERAVRLHQPRCQTLPLSVYEGMWTHSPPLVAMHLLDISCVIVGIFLKYCVPQQTGPSSSLVVLGEALLEYRAPPPPPRHRAAAGRSLPQPLPLPLLDQGIGDVTGMHVCCVGEHSNFKIFPTRTQDHGDA